MKEKRWKRLLRAAPGGEGGPEDAPEGLGSGCGEVMGGGCWPAWPGGLAGLGQPVKTKNDTKVDPEYATNMRTICCFDAVVTEVALYGCAAWKLTAAEQQALRTTRRNIVRWMWGAHRKVDEDWVDFVQRATKESEANAAIHGSRQWAGLFLERKFRFAGKVARCSLNKWSTRLLSWQPWFCEMPFRAVGRPLTRWEDSFVQVAGGDWAEHAKDEAIWMAMSIH